MLHIKEHHDETNPQTAEQIRNSVYELSEFLTDVLKVGNITASFPHKAGLYTSCHGQRGLHISSMSELVAEPFSKPEKLLNMVKGLQLSKPGRSNECCGFGGTFCVFEKAVSVIYWRPDQSPYVCLIHSLCIKNKDQQKYPWVENRPLFENSRPSWYNLQKKIEIIATLFENFRIIMCSLIIRS